MTNSDNEKDNKNTGNKKTQSEFDLKQMQDVFKKLEGTIDEGVEVFAGAAEHLKTSFLDMASKFKKTFEDSFDVDSKNEGSFKDVGSNQNNRNNTKNGDNNSSDNSKLTKEDIDIHTSPTAHKEGHIVSEGAPKPVGPYPHARKVGDFLFLSGVGPRRKSGSDIPGVTFDSSGRVIAEDITAQTEAVFENILSILQAANAQIEDIVDVQVYLTNMKRDFKTFNKIYGKYLGPVGATRTTIEVSSLPTPICVELKVVAYLGK